MKPNLTVYQYTGTNLQGKNITGTITALNLTVAKINLRKQGLRSIHIKKQPRAFFSFRFRQKITTSEITLLTRQLTTLIIAGIPLVQSLDILSKETDHFEAQTLILNIKAKIENGLSFSETLKKFPIYFDDLFCNLIYAGETSGSLDHMLDSIANHKEKTESLKRKLKKAMLYPSIVLIIALTVSILLLIYVVPQFEELFKNFGAELPFFTLMIIRISRVLQHQGYTMAVSLFSLGYLFNYLNKHSNRFKFFLNTVILKIPIISNIIKKTVIARYARTLATTFAAGVPLTQALQAVAGAAGNMVYTRAILNIQTEVTRGSQIHIAMKNTGLFPNRVIQMVAIGEESGSLDIMLNKAAILYEEEVSMAVDSLTNLLEPILTIILSIIIGALVIAMYLPIFKMGSII